MVVRWCCLFVVVVVVVVLFVDGHRGKNVRLHVCFRQASGKREEGGVTGGLPAAACLHPDQCDRNLDLDLWSGGELQRYLLLPYPPPVHLHHPTCCAVLAFGRKEVGGEVPPSGHWALGTGQLLVLVLMLSCLLATPHSKPAG